MKFLVLGSVNIDETYRVEHIVKEGETISCKGLSRSAGGKGANQAAALAKAGADVSLACKIGNDGLWILDILSSYGADVSRAVVSERAGTGKAIIQVDERGENSIIIVSGGNGLLAGADIDDMLSGYGEGDVIVLQNEVNKLAVIMSAALEKGMKIALNPSPFDDSLLSLPLEKVHYLILNEVEACSIIGEDKISDDIEYRAAITALHRKFPDTVIVLTAGADGAMCFYDNQVHYSAGYSVEVADTTGAGDTFLGYFLHSMESGLGVVKALDKANKAASLAVSRRGAMESIPFMDELLL